MVMQQYLERGGTGQAFDEYTSIPAPPGTSLGDLSAQGMFSEVGDALGLRPMGIFTPWATRTGDINWEEIRNPDTNVATWEINDAQVNAVPQMTFGSPLPFVSVLTKRPMTDAEVAAMWSGTAYKPYETQAMYRQDDAKGVPTIFFIHWGERVDIAELPKQTLALVPRAASVGGQLVFAAQIPHEGSTTRSPPAVASFQDALEGQLMTAPAAPAPSAPPASDPAPIQASAPAAPAASGKTNLSLPIAVGLGAAALSYLLWRHVR